MVGRPTFLRNTRRWVARAGALVVAALLPWGLWRTRWSAPSLARADTFDPAAPVVRVVGPPLGYAPRPRIDGARTGRAVTALPTRAAEAWRRRLLPIATTPAVADNGDVVVVVGTEVVRIDKTGKSLWSTTLDQATAFSAPVLTSDGAVVVVDNGYVLWRVDRAGHVQWRSPLPVNIAPARRRARQRRVTSLAVDDGSVLVALEQQLLRVDAAGELLLRQSLQETLVGGVLRWGKRYVVTTDSGAVWAWQPPEALTRLGELGGHPRGGGLLAGERTLAAVVDGDRLVALDLKTGVVTPLVTAGTTGSPLQGPPTLDYNGILLVTSAIGELLGVNSHGELVRRAAIENVGLLGSRDGGAPFPVVGGSLSTSPPLISDRAGRLAFVRASGRVGLLDEHGELSTVARRLCSVPIAVLPAGDGRMLVACESGTLAMYENETP